MERNRTKLSLVVGAVCATMLTLTAPAAHAQAAEDDHTATLAALKTFQASAGPGAAIHAGGVGEPWTLAAGTGTFNSDRPIRSDEHYRIGSQTKTFTAAVVLQLVDENKISLDAAIADYLPGVITGNGYDGTRITVRQLLQHTSGLAAYTPQVVIDRPVSNPDGTYDLAEVVRKGLSYAPVSAPGAGFTYSNTNYLVLGMLVEKVTGQPVHEAVTSRVIEPLGLSRTAFPAPGDRALPTPAVNGYHGVRVGSFYFWTPAATYDPSLFSTAGAMISTLEDLTAFYRALLAGRVVSAAGLAEMQKVREAGPGVSFGLGIGRKELSCGIVAWGHSGGVPGYMSQTMVAENGRHASVVTNALFQVNPPADQLHELLDTALCEDAAQRP
ncbi:beta-lactamase family protein [Streptomyces albidoflavus]|uniref:Beta-lactamase family protein n=1 Tax=Streptomyces fungicidicus TaxID=68203 RepID=A0ACC7Y728_9ACTN|nr:beta-lactamase family protein [Streptomyces albidoflavus]NUV77833.1 beta-lactamase family protein [Streptomyces fungicidicus]